MWIKVNGFYTGPCHGNSPLIKGFNETTTGTYHIRFDDGAYTNLNNCVNTSVYTNNENFWGPACFRPFPGYSPYIQTNNWISVIYTYDGQTAKLYINCDLKFSNIYPGLFFNNSYDLLLGKLTDPAYPYWFNGAIDEVRIYNRALNTDEINFLASNGQFINALANLNTVCTGTATQLDAAGASTYSWSPATGLDNPNISNPIATPLITTQYIVTGTNACGCTSKDTVLITVNPKPIITKSNDTLICKNASAQLNAGGGNTYSWSPAATLNNPNIANPVATPASDTKYHVTVTDANNCSNTESVMVSIRPDPVFSVSPPGNLCENNSVQLAASGGDIYAWQPSASLDNTNSPNPIASPGTTTTYSVQITETTCNNSKTLSTTITVVPSPVVHASKSNDVDCSNDASNLSATGAVSYSWSPAATLNDPNIQNPIARPTTTTLYTVKGTDANGCTNVDTVTVYVNGTNKGAYLMPNAFTPNNDGKNDCYGIKYWGIIQELDFSIYNRWGERIFHSKQPGQCWDGTYKGKPQNPGIYIYLIRAKTSCDEDVFRKGTFTLIR